MKNGKTGDDIRIQHVIDAVCEVRRIGRRDLLASTRHQPATRYRQEAMAIARELTGHTTPVIARHLGRKDHSTVVYACQQVAGREASDPAYAAELMAIRKRVAVVSNKPMARRHQRPASVS